QAPANSISSQARGPLPGAVAAEAWWPVWARGPCSHQAGRASRAEEGAPWSCVVKLAILTEVVEARFLMQEKPGVGNVPGVGAGQAERDHVADPQPPGPHARGQDGLGRAELAGDGHRDAGNPRAGPRMGPGAVGDDRERLAVALGRRGAQVVG